jgi:polyisoprenyl-phosphate glycosyltransferase
MIEYSIVVPCYNEAENLKSLIEGFASFINADHGELIIVDNGSNDDTASTKEELMSRYPFLKWVRIEKNIGYGHGIYTGLLHAQGKIMGYTHADLQTDPFDVCKAIELLKSFPEDKKILVKGHRRGRGFVDRFFSHAMEFFVKIYLKQSLQEINAQPNVFTKDVFNNLKDPPIDWAFDLYLYYISKETGSLIKRFDVIFPGRKKGKSKWRTNFFSRISLSYRMLEYCKKLKNQ